MIFFCRLTVLFCVFFAIQKAYAYDVSFKREGIYMQIVKGYHKNRLKTSNTLAFVAENPSPGMAKLNNDYKTDNVKGSGIRVGGGYRWKIDNNWSWSIGGYLGKKNLATKGKVKPVNERVDNANAVDSYRYKIAAKTADVTGRIIYTQGIGDYYAGLSFGLVKLKSRSCKLADAAYNKKTVSGNLYGGSLGALYHIYSGVGVGIELGYMGMSHSRLGERRTETGSTSGHIKQKFKMINTSVNLTYQF